MCPIQPGQPRGLEEDDLTGGVRITWQATPRNKIGFSTDPQSCTGNQPERMRRLSLFQLSFQHETYDGHVFVANHHVFA